MRVIQGASFCSMQRFRSRIAGDDKVGVVAETLQAAIPNIAVNIIIGAWGQPKKRKGPTSGEGKTSQNHAPRKCRGGAGATSAKQFTNCEQVGNPRQCQENHEGRAAAVAKVA